MSSSGFVPPSDDGRCGPGPEQAARMFEERFGRPPTLLVEAPGRVNLLGEHTDYNEGLVLPAAIDRRVYAAAGPAIGATVRAFSREFGQEARIDLRNPRPSTSLPWSNYLGGVVSEFRRREMPVAAFNYLLCSDIPVGAGLSSSAALLVAFAEACRLMSGVTLSPFDLAHLCWDAERCFVGLECGIMDQFISVLAPRDAALLIDCRSLDHEAIPLPSAWRIVVCDTGVRRELSHSEYNNRRRECVQAARLLRPELGEKATLRDADSDLLERAVSRLSALHYRRARHVLTENRRVLVGVEALKSGDLDAFGDQMNASHRSLREDYEVSSPELDVLVEEAWKHPGTLGSRMTGAGFGGCTVSLVCEAELESFRTDVACGFRARTGLEATIYPCRPGSGVCSRPFKKRHNLL